MLFFYFFFILLLTYTNYIAEEKAVYHPSVTVEFNGTAYNNEKLIVKWINEELNIIVGGKNNKVLLIMDAASFYKIKEVFNTFDKYGIN